MRPSQSTVRTVFALSGGVCAFPECRVGIDDGSAAALELAQIAATNPGGPRYDPAGEPEASISADNFLVLCANHHNLIDADPGTFDASALREMRASRLVEITNISGPGVNGTASSLDAVLKIWTDERANGNEEFWHQLFEDSAWVLALLIPSTTLVLRSKCYVGGKSVENTGSNLVDFIAQGSANVALIEIKSPTTELISGQYRGNVFTPSRELVGASMQVIEYRASLLQSLSQIQPEDMRMDAPDPLALVLVGDLEREDLSAKERRSFELFRQALRNINVVTYDELFARLAEIGRVVNLGRGT